MTLVTTTHLSGLRPLGVGSQQVIDGYPQLVQVIESRLGAADAALFARPERRSDAGWIDWHSAREGEVVPLAELAPERRAAVEAEVDAIIARVRGLAESLQRGDGSARFFGEVLARATSTPGPDSIYLVGDQPVLVLWGFEAESRMPAFVPPAVPASAAAGTTLGALAVGPDPRRGRWAALWRWLLLLLMLALLLLLLLKACEPLEPLVVDRQAAPEDLKDKIDAAIAEAAGLDRELKELQGLRDQQLAACIAPTPPPQLPAQNPPAQEPPPATPPTQTAEVPKLAPLPSLPAIPMGAPPVAVVPPTPSPPAAGPAPPSCVPQRKPHDAPEVVLVVDGSGSMGDPMPGAGSRLDAAKRSIGQFVDGLPGDVDVALIEFGDCNRVNRDSFYSPAQRGMLKQRVDGLRPMNGTPLGLSVERAGRIISSVRPGIIVVVSDGNDTCRGDPCAAARAIAASKPNVRINVIDIGGDSRGAAQCIAQPSGGHVYQPSSVAEMEQMIRQASGEPDVRTCQ